MYGDKAHSSLLAAGWRWENATDYHTNVDELALTLHPERLPPADMPFEKGLTAMREGRWLLRAQDSIIGAFDGLPAAAVALLVGRSYVSSPTLRAGTGL